MMGSSTLYHRCASTHVRQFIFKYCAAIQWNVGLLIHGYHKLCIVDRMVHAVCVAGFMHYSVHYMQKIHVNSFFSVDERLIPHFHVFVLLLLVSLVDC